MIDFSKNAEFDVLMKQSESDADRKNRNRNERNAKVDYNFADRDATSTRKSGSVPGFITQAQIDVPKTFDKFDKTGLRKYRRKNDDFEFE